MYRETYSTDASATFINVMMNGADCMPFSITELSNMMKNPMHHIKKLRNWSRWAYDSNGTITTAIDGLRSIHTLDYYIVSRRKNGVAPASYKDSYILMDEVLRNIRYKSVIRDGIFKDANDGMYVAYFETKNIIPNKNAFLSDIDVYNITQVNADGVNCVVIPLPIDYVRIIGRRNNCYEVAFDLRYFDNINDDDRKRKLQGMPKQIRDGYDKYHNNPENSGKNWLRLDWRKTIVTKIKSGMNDPYGIPFAIAALDDIEFAKYFVDTKRKVLDTVNNNIYYETFPEGKDKGTSALTREQQKKQHDKVKDALSNRTKSGVSFFSLAAGTKMDSLPTNIDILNEENENAISEDVNEDIGFSAAALNGKSSGNYATATLNMELIASNVFTWIEDIVNELNKCINYNIIKNKEVYIEFKVLPVTFVNRDKFVKFYSDLYARGKGSLIAWIASTGINPNDYISLMDYELDEDFENKYPVHKTSFTVTGKDSPDTDVDGSENPSTKSTQDNNGNAMPSPSD